jgi:subtilisin family serine protease
MPSAALGAPFIWDQDDDSIDDRIETVNLYGYSFSFEDADTLAPQRFEVVRQAGGLYFGAYVVFDHMPTDSDLLLLTSLGMPVLHRYENVPAVRTRATYLQIEAAVGQSGVERVEAVPLLYPQVHDGLAAIGARDPAEHVFPTWAGTGGADGTGVAVAILDTGINDAPDGAYPGHESLAGRFLGGAEFVHDDSLLDTPRNGSVNPEDRGGTATHSHGTHVAGITLGTGGASGYAIGVAPGARFVDVKVLNDAGTGTEVGEGIDWCIHNRSRDWGVPGYAGIQVINLSLSSIDRSDGNDVVSRLADRAAELGLVVVASVGNGGHDHFIPSPAGSSRTLAVGAMDVQHTGPIGDDGWATFDNYGPRDGDGDSDPADEQKPDLLAPGVAVLSADGSLVSNGAQYQRLNGTSMAAAFVSGAVAALRSAYPSLTPAQIGDLLRRTARRDLAGTPAETTGADPRWRSSIGFGVVDLYAARLEMEQPQRSQPVQLELSASPTAISAVLRMQRERGAAAFVFERAPDVGGAPGAFAGYDSVAAAGDSSLADATDRVAYSRNWIVPVGERGATFWYRISFTEAGARFDSPAVRFTSPIGPPAATLEFTVVHDAYDHDIAGLLSSTGPGGSWNAALPGTRAAFSGEWVTGESTTGTVEWTFHVDVPQGVADRPSSSQPWWLRVDEAGYVNRVGRITEYRLIWHGAGGDEIYEGGPVPMPTIEGQSVFASIPYATTGVGGPVSPAGVRFGPNPVVAGSTVSFAVSGSTVRTLDVFDLSGRRVARAPFTPGSSGAIARWTTRSASGQPLAPGIYLARVGGSAVVRVAVIRP